MLNNEKLTPQSLKLLMEKTKEFKILYVEDSEDARNQFVKMLKNFSSVVDTAYDGLDGLEQYRSKDVGYYDIVISDINMPRLNGLKMLKIILEINPFQDNIVTTAYNDTDNLEELIHLGISNYIRKPVQNELLVIALNKSLKSIESKQKSKYELEQIKQINNDLDALLDNFDNYVLASRTNLYGEINYVSKAFLALNGYSKNELIGNKHKILKSNDMPDSLYKEIWQHISQQRLWKGKIKNIKKDGTFYWVNTTIVPYSDKNNNHIGYGSIYTDITIHKNLEYIHNDIRGLLDNVSQGFLSFNHKMQVSKGHSKECLRIFKTDSIYKKNISQLLFYNDKSKQELFEDGISNIFSSDDTMIRDLYISLLPKENTINDMDLDIKYKFVSVDKLMLIITDITDTRKLKKRLVAQENIQTMIVSVASNKNNFIDLKEEFEHFILNPSYDLQTLQRKLHTFKGNFTQMNMLYISSGIHNFESEIESKSYEYRAYEEIINSFNKQNFLDIFNKDLEIIKDTLGNDYLNNYSKISINADILHTLIERVKSVKSTKEELDIETLLKDLQSLNNDTIYYIFSNYADKITNISKRLHKNLNPLVIDGDNTLRADKKLLPFFNTLIHLFNNSVEHGIEHKELRDELKKESNGTISCSFKKVSSILEIAISDDGNGINLESICSNAINNAIISQIELDSMSTDERLLLIFKDKLSSKNEISLLSGRGVGMGAIKDEIDKLDGTISIKNGITKGVKFIFKIPLGGLEC